MFARKKISAQSDEELLLLFRREKKQDIVGELFSRYSHLVFGLCMKYLRNKEDARDATFSLFEKLLQDLANHEIEKFPNWLCTVSRNHCLMILRKKNTSEQQLRTLQATWTPENDSDSHDLLLSKEKNLDQLQEAIGSLNEGQQLCVKLFFIEEKSYREISTQTGLTINEVKTNIQNGKRNLKIKLTGTA